MFDNYKSIDDYKEVNGYTIDDVWYPRVTRIVGIKAKPALYRYYGEATNFKTAQEITQKSAEEGTLVHETVEGLLLGKNPQIPESIRPSIEAFQNFLVQKNIHVSPDYVEHRVHHPEHRYAGTLDAVALIDGKFGILDIKTSQGIYRDYNLQTSAYIEALKDKLPQLQTRWILRIDQGSVCEACGATRRVKGGREKIKNPYPRSRGTCLTHVWGDTQGIIELQEFPYWKSDFEAFLGAKRLWEWEEESWLKKVGYLS